jgi:hypothetical protein
MSDLVTAAISSPPTCHHLNEGQSTAGGIAKNGGRDRGNLWDGSAHFEEAGNCLVPTVVKVEIVYAQNLAGAREGGSYGICCAWKNALLKARHHVNDQHRFRL